MKTDEEIISIISELQKYPFETEWAEFKQNKSEPSEIGEYISALANSAALNGKISAYMIWGVEDNNHEIIGTSFKPSKKKVGNEELENWLLHKLNPKINFSFYNVVIDDKPLVMLEINTTMRQPVQFQNVEYIRIGSYKKKLKDFPEKERELWRIFDRVPFEEQIAYENASDEDVVNLLDYPEYFNLLKRPLPETRSSIIEIFKSEEFIKRNNSGSWNITNLGAILFARNLKRFKMLKRKAVRVIVYNGENKYETKKEQEGQKGYACGFEGLIDFIGQFIPANEVIEKALRIEKPMYPLLAIRELVANAIIHQDFYKTGTSPMIEIFSNRIELTNPGLPLVKTDRFLDSPPKSRNEMLAAFLRRAGVCEERGSGIDKVVFQTELYQLPAPVFETTEEHTRTILFSHREFREMDKNDKIRATYLHACLKYVQRDFMTNTSLRERFGIDEKNSATASRIIKDTMKDNKIRVFDDTVGSKARKYVPWWA